MEKVLLIGFGKIAKIHAKYLVKNNVSWDWYDPYLGDVDEELGKRRIKELGLNLLKYEKVMVLAPEKEHYNIIKNLRDTGYSGYIFVEKPAVLLEKELHIINDDKILVGLVERYNPAIIALINDIDREKVINIDFSRCSVSEHSSEVSVFEDLGIHDIDLYYLISGEENYDLKYNIISKQKSTFLTIDEKVIGRFVWSKDTYFKERKVIVRQTNCTYEVDLQEQSVRKYYFHKNKIVCESLYVEKSSPIENEQINFFSKNPKRFDCFNSHFMLAKILEGR